MEKSHSTNPLTNSITDNLNNDPRYDPSKKENLHLIFSGQFLKDVQEFEQILKNFATLIEKQYQSPFKFDISFLIPQGKTIRRKKKFGDNLGTFERFDEFKSYDIIQGYLEDMNKIEDESDLQFENCYPYLNDESVYANAQRVILFLNEDIKELSIEYDQDDLKKKLIIISLKQIQTENQCSKIEVNEAQLSDAFKIVVPKNNPNPEVSVNVIRNNVPLRTIPLDIKYVSLVGEKVKIELVEETEILNSEQQQFFVRIQNEKHYEFMDADVMTINQQQNIYLQDKTLKEQFLKLITEKKFNEIYSFQNGRKFNFSFGLKNKHSNEYKIGNESTLDIPKIFLPYENIESDKFLQKVEDFVKLMKTFSFENPIEKLQELRVLFLGENTETIKNFIEKIQENFETLEHHKQELISDNFKPSFQELSMPQREPSGNLKILFDSLDRKLSETEQGKLEKLLNPDENRISINDEVLSCAYVINIEDLQQEFINKENTKIQEELKSDMKLSLVKDKKINPFYVFTCSQQFVRDMRLRDENPDTNMILNNLRVKNIIQQFTAITSISLENTVFLPITNRDDQDFLKMDQFMNFFTKIYEYSKAALLEKCQQNLIIVDWDSFKHLLSKNYPLEKKNIYRLNFFQIFNKKIDIDCPLTHLKMFMDQMEIKHSISQQFFTDQSENNIKQFNFIEQGCEFDIYIDGQNYKNNIIRDISHKYLDYNLIPVAFEVVNKEKSYVPDESIKNFFTQKEVNQYDSFIKEAQEINLENLAIPLISAKYFFSYENQIRILESQEKSEPEYLYQVFALKQHPIKRIETFQTIIPCIQMKATQTLFSIKEAIKQENKCGLIFSFAVPGQKNMEASSSIQGIDENEIIEGDPILKSTKLENYNQKLIQQDSDDFKREDAAKKNELERFIFIIEYTIDKISFITIQQSQEKNYKGLQITVSKENQQKIESLKLSSIRAFVQQNIKERVQSDVSQTPTGDDDDGSCERNILSGEFSFYSLFRIQVSDEEDGLITEAVRIPMDRENEIYMSDQLLNEHFQKQYTQIEKGPRNHLTFFIDQK